MSESDSDWSWLESRGDELSGQKPDAVAEIFNTELAKIDDRLEAEVSDGEGRRTVVISANRKAEAFDLVRSLVGSAPSLRGWDFVALRPAKGFEFEFRAGRRIDARALTYSARKTNEGMIVRLLVPNPEWEGWADNAWQVIEAGIGEVAAAGLAGLEVSKRDADEDARPIETLAGYLKRNG